MKNLTTLDKNYLRLQFWNKVYKKNATEFQRFFEDIMQNAFSDFQKIKPYGNKGDGGNDGYRPKKGIYYQVYAPEDPNEKKAQAAKKLKEDFVKLKSSWDEISKIKKYYFAFNDKGAGVGVEIEKALSELKVKNKKIGFEKFIPRDLEDIFFSLKEDQILALGFDIDSTNALKIAKEYLKKIEVELDRDNATFVFKALNNLKDIISTLKNEDLILDFEILEARTSQRLEKVKEAKEKYENLNKRYPNDPRAFLYLAEIVLNNGDLKKNEELLKQAESIDKTHWLLTLERLIRAYVSIEAIDLSKVDAKSFPNDPKIKSDFYRIYSGFYEESGDHAKADSFIEKAIHFNPDKFSNYDAKLSILERRFYFSEDDREKRLKKVDNFLSEIDSIEQKISIWGELGARNKAIICYRKFNAFRMREDLSGVEKNAKECFELLLQCYFDRLIDNLLVGILAFVELPEDDLKRLFSYLNDAEKEISDDLAKRLIFQFFLKDTLFTEGKEYFKKINNKRILDFIDNLKNKNYDKVMEFLSDDPLFAVAIANTAKNFPDLRTKIIESLPNDGTVQKDKLLLLLNYDEGEMDKAFDLLKKFDLSNLGYLESRQVLKVAQGKRAWDFVVKLLENLLQHEKDRHIILQLKLQLFTANFNLDRFKEASQVGEEILSNKKGLALLGDSNKESLLGQTIFVKMKRGEFKPAKKLMEDHLDLFKTFDFILGVKVDVYLKNNDANSALASIVEGIKLIKTPSPEQYGYLLIFFTEIGNMIDFPLTSMKKVVNNCFVKLKGQDRWYFIGDNDELDATKIPQDDDDYSKFSNKKVDDEIVIGSKYRAKTSKCEIEMILPIGKYILWQCRHNAEKLTIENRWKAMEIIDVPSTAEGIDPKYIIARLEDDRKARGEFFNMYTQKSLPLAFLAINQGGLTKAIGHILNEQRGFVNFSSGNFDEIGLQKETAKRMIAGEEFYIDGTSALVLSETGLLEDIYQYLPNLKVPQSVITLLLEVKEKFRYVPGQVGHMAYSQGKLLFSSVDPKKGKKIRSNFERSVKLLESKPQNTKAISGANKTGEFSEQRIDPALCDACILAQRDKALVLTEDYLYLKVNELETKKQAPEYCSSFALIRELYEQGKLNFDKYLAFFSYLASYRFRFLPIIVEDIEKAVFGDGEIKTFSPQNIHLLNFPLTLSKEYGVPFEKAFPVVGRFLVNVLIDDAVVPEMAEKIFAEVIDSFPSDMDKKLLSQMFLRVCVQAINSIQQGMIVGTKIQEKVDSLSKFIEIYDRRNIILP